MQYIVYAYIRNQNHKIIFLSCENSVGPIWTIIQFQFNFNLFKYEYLNGDIIDNTY